MQTVGLAEANLVGHSMGGYVTMALAAMRPEKIKRLVLVDSIGTPFDRSLPRLVYPALKAVGRTPLAFWPYMTYDYLRAGPRMVWKAARQILALDATEVIAAVRVPTLLIWGSEDDLVPLSLGRALHERVTNSRLLVLPGANHFCMFERARDFNHALLNFLQGREVGVLEI
jgi:pimeloyl-ACP methyl ester carboxylesterase